MLSHTARITLQTMEEHRLREETVNSEEFYLFHDSEGFHLHQADQNTAVDDDDDVCDECGGELCRHGVCEDCEQCPNCKVVEDVE